MYFHHEAHHNFPALRTPDNTLALVRHFKWQNQQKYRKSDPKYKKGKLVYSMRAETKKI